MLAKNNKERVQRNRLTLLETTYYQTKSGKVLAVENRTSRYLPNSNENQPYQRTLQIGREWQPLDLGWIPAGSYCLIVIQNELPSNKAFAGSSLADIAQAHSSRKILLRFVGDTQYWIIPAGDSFRGTTDKPLEICGLNEGITVTVTVIQS